MAVIPRIPFVARIPILAAILMIVVGVLASQQVLLALNRLQDERVRELARLHVEALSVALGPHVLRNDVWEVYDTLTRASGQEEGRRIAFTAVAGQDDHVMAATDPVRAPIGMAMGDLVANAALPEDLSVLSDQPILRLAAPLVYQGRTVGRLFTELDVADLLSERRSASRLLILGNAAAILILSIFGYFVTMRMLRPLQSLTQHMSDYSDGPTPFSAEEFPKGDTELSRLFLTYNRMVAAAEEKNEAERRLAERERFVSLGRLSSSLAHEINNPLGGLKNAADTIRKFADRPDVVRQSADLLIRGLNHMAEVAKATLDMNRIDRQDAALSAQDIDDMKTLVEPELRRRAQELHWRVDVDDGWVWGLPAAPVRQIILNLLLNASAVAGQGGRVQFGLKYVTGCVEIAVCDSGPGLSDEAKRRLLSDHPLPPGGGMGLRLVHDIVAELNGKIGSGNNGDLTQITVSIPTTQQGSAPHA